MSALLTRTAAVILVGLVGAVTSPLVQAQTDGRKKEITSPGHTVDMPGRESHGPEHIKDKKKAGGKPVKSPTAHTVDMPGREPHKKQPRETSERPVSTTGHTVDMPGREEHSEAHEKKK